MNPQRDRGIRAELEACKRLSELLNLNVRRMATEGRFEDLGDLFGVPDTTIQVSAVPDTPTKIASRAAGKAVDVERQRQRAGTTHAVVLLRIDGGHWRAICSTHYLRAIGVDLARMAVFINPPGPGHVIRWAPLFTATTWSQVTGNLYAATLEGWARTWKGTL